MGLLDSMRQKSYQRRQMMSKEVAKDIKETFMQLASEGEGIEGMLVIFMKHGKINVMEGGLHDDFEAQVFIQRAQYLINRDGLVTP